MPFPLHALDYGSRCRLRQLATPGEAYDLQIAAPDFNGLNPIQKIEPFVLKFIVIDGNNQFCAKSSENFLSRDKLYDTSKLMLRKFTYNHSAQMIFDLVVNTRYIEFVSCQLTSTFLQDFVAKYKEDVTEVVFRDCTFDTGVSLDFVCGSFNEMHTLTFVYTHLLSRTDPSVTKEYPNLRSIDIVHVMLDIFDIDETRFVNFVKAQNASFNITINIYPPIPEAEVERRLNSRFNESYWRFEESYVPSTVNIHWSSRKLDTLRSRSYFLLDHELERKQI